jgi:hypothetical protein
MADHTTDWEQYALNQTVPKQGLSELYTQAQGVNALLTGLKFTRQKNVAERIEWRDKPLRLLKVDLWTEGIVRSREVLETAIRVAAKEGYYFSSSSIYSMDIASVTCQKARQYIPYHIAQASITNLPFKRDSFDIIFDPSTSDHVELGYAVAAWNNYQFCLKPNGILVLYFSHSTGTLAKKKDGTYYTFPIKDVLYALRQCGFSILQENSLYIFNTVPGSLLPHYLLTTKLLQRFEYSRFSKYAQQIAPLYLIIARKDK